MMLVMRLAVIGLFWDLRNYYKVTVLDDEGHCDNAAVNVITHLLTAGNYASMSIGVSDLVWSQFGPQNRKSLNQLINMEVLWL